MDPNNLIVKVYITCIFFAMFSISSESKSLINTGSESQVNCSSSNMTITQLKAAASNISCPNHDEQDFWEAACKCVVFELPKSKCPLCPMSREAEWASTATESSSAPVFQPNDTPARRNANQTSSTETVDRNTSSQHVTHDDSGELARVKSHTTIDSSANFIRFGK